LNLARNHYILYLLLCVVNLNKMKLSLNECRAMIEVLSDLDSQLYCKQIVKLQNRIKELNNELT